MPRSHVCQVMRSTYTTAPATSWLWPVAARAARISVGVGFMISPFISLSLTKPARGGHLVWLWRLVLRGIRNKWLKT